MTVKESKEFIFENYYRRIGFNIEKSYYSMIYQKKKYLLLLGTKLTKIPDTNDAKEYYKSFWKTKAKNCFINQK